MVVEAVVMAAVARQRSEGGGRPVLADPADADSTDRSVKLLQGLADYLENCGGTQDMVDGWYTKTEFRMEGATAGTYDSYFFSPQGKRFRSKAEIARYFNLEAAPAVRTNKTAEQKAVEKAAAKEAKQNAKDADRAERDTALKAALELARRYPMADDKLPDEGPTDPPLPPMPLPLPFDASPLHPNNTGDVLQIIDFIQRLGPRLIRPRLRPTNTIQYTSCFTICTSRRPRAAGAPRQPTFSPTTIGVIG